MKFDMAYALSFRTVRIMEIYPLKVPKTSTDSKFDKIMTYLGSFEVKHGSNPEIRVKSGKVAEIKHNHGQKQWSELVFI